MKNKVLKEDGKFYNLSSNKYVIKKWKGTPKPIKKWICKDCEKEIEKEYEENPNRRCKKCDHEAHTNDFKESAERKRNTKPFNSKGIFSRIGDGLK
jgi:uncharacterized protein YlaI